MVMQHRRPGVRPWNEPARPAVTHAEILSLIGRDLRSLYAHLVEEAVPEHLTPYVEKLMRRGEKPAH